MQETDFKVWLQEQGYDAGTVSTQIARLKRIEAYYGELADKARDGSLDQLEAQFTYSTQDERNGKPSPVQIPIAGNLRTSLASYKSTIAYYRRFIEGGKIAASHEAPETEISREAVLATMEECDRLGLDDFLKTYGFGKPRDYWVMGPDNAKRYPAKATVGVAHGQISGGSALSAAEFSGGFGEQAANTTLRKLGFVVVNWPELLRARESFLRQMAGFTSFREPAGAYWDIERRYKNQLIEDARAIAASNDDDRTVGEGIYRILVSGQQGVPLNWRTLSEVQSAGSDLTDRFFIALGQLARNEASAEEAITTTSRELEALRGAGIAGLRRGEVLSIPITIWATLHPEEASWFKIAKIEEMGKCFFGRKLFPQNEFREADFAEWLQLMRALFGLLEREFGWEPQDLFDVQGFVWVALGGNDKLRDAMTDEEILARFDNCDYFRTRRQRWTEQQTKAFCLIARAAHDVGLDWYRTNIPQIRLGRKATQEGPARATLASFDASPGRLRFTHSAHQVGLDGFIDCDDNGATEFGKLMEDKRAILASWMAPEPPRDGYWPGSVSTSDGVIEGSVSEESAQATNLILYGPPGTGKTYRTAAEAVRICDRGAKYADDEAGRAALMARYVELVKKERIEFVTFHQNFSYEDFVEGLRPPIASEDGQAQVDGPQTGLSLRVHPGIFRDLAQRAELDRGSRDGRALDNQRSVFKVALGEKGSEEDHIREALDAGEVTLGWGGSIDWSDPQYDEFSAILSKWQTDVDADATGKDANVEQLNALRAWMQEGDYIVVSDGRDRFRAFGEVTGPYEFRDTVARHPHRRRVRWLWRDDEGLDRSVFYPKWFRRHSLYCLDPTAIDWAALAQIVIPQSKGENGRSPAHPYVLVIDEINRANISKVFGELITLIEPDKRLGQPNALKVRLPYSKREFGVPSNLHIIGTMNTADRSIALLDTALRRRFRFEEISPDTAVPAFQQAEADSGLPLAKVLDTMNQRIEYLVDRDHRIGHAFFIGCDSKAKVDAVMRDKVIPLLQEYFFDDWNRLAAVLGERDKGGNFLDCSEIKDPMGEGQSIKSWRVKRGFEESAYHRLVSGRAALPSAELANDDEAVGELA